jgi:hypothetical protein
MEIGMIVNRRRRQDSSKVRRQKFGGYVDMEDDVYLEFEEEEEVKKDPDEAPT